MNEEILKYQIAIGQIPKIGGVLARKLIAYTGSAEAVFKEKKENLLKIPGIGEHIANEICNQNVLGRSEEEIKFISKYNIKPLFYLDKNYPQRLTHCADAPIIIFVKGNIDFNCHKVISIVGTRNATSIGKDNCEKLIGQLAERKHNPLIVSGLAYGIDIISHKAALKNNLQTVGVLAHGLDKIYPSVHASVAKDMIHQGGLVTEFFSSTKMDRNYFLQRNRIIAGLSDATIIVESGAKGGSLVTGDIANSYNRDVFAFPGRINDKYSAGCNRIIKINKAHLIEDVKDIEYILGWDAKKSKKPAVQMNLFADLSKEERILVDVLKSDQELHIDIISHKTQLSVSKASYILLNLEFLGVVKSLPGNTYALK